MVSAPPLTTPRRENLTCAFMSASLPGGALAARRHHGANDAHMRAAAAQIAVELGANLLLGWLLVALEQCNRSHDHAAGAVTALRHLLLDESGLHGMRRA